MATARLQSLASAHFSTAANTSTGKRVVTAGSNPVAGLPRPLFFSCTRIDFFIISVYNKNQTEGKRRPKWPSPGKSEQT